MKPALLIVKEGVEPGRQYAVETDETLIGRHPNTDITLVDKGVSREHAVILWEEDGYAIEDLQSTNGICVNGKRVRSSPLNSGDELRIGSHLFCFEYTG